MYKSRQSRTRIRFRGRSRRIKRGIKSRRVRRVRIGGCSECTGSSPPVAPLWNSFG